MVYNVSNIIRYLHNQIIVITSSTRMFQLGVQGTVHKTFLFNSVSFIEIKSYNEIDLGNLEFFPKLRDSNT